MSQATQETKLSEAEQKLHNDYEKVREIKRAERKAFMKRMRRPVPLEKKSIEGKDVHAKLLAVSQYGKLILQTNDDNTIDHLMTLSEGFKHLEMTKQPVWTSDSDEGLVFKASVPKFMKGDLFTIEKYIGQDVLFSIEGHSYDHKTYGKGWFIKLSSNVKLVSPEAS